MTVEYRIRLAPGNGAGYWGGKREGFTLYTDAETALAEYRRTVQADSFISYQERRRHLEAIRIESRIVSDWTPTPDPGQGPLPPVTP